MKSMPIVLILAASIALAGCSSDTKPALTDDQLAHEYVSKVYGKQLEDAAAGPTAASAAALDSANSNCTIMREGQKDGLLSTKTGDPANATWIHDIEIRSASSASWTARQTLDALEISAKYKCPEFTPMLQDFDAVHGTN